MSSFDDAILEMKRHAEAKRDQEQYLKKLNESTTKIRANITSDEIRSWKLVELLIVSGSRFYDVNEEHIRDLLKGDEK